jgi:hypothetical protein
MLKITRLLFVLVLFPLLLSTETRAETVVITSGSMGVRGVSGFPHGYFNFINKAQGFTASGYFSEGFFKRASVLPYTDPPNSIIISFLPSYERSGSVTIDGVTYSGLNVLYSPTNAAYPIIAQPLVLPPPDPSIPHTDTLPGFVDLTVPFVLDAVMDTYPCGVGQTCNRLLTNRLTGQGIARAHFAVHFGPNNSYFYEFFGVDYEFLPSATLSTLSAGNGEQRFAFNISEHGNLRSLQSPANLHHISNREGYALCSNGAAAFDDGETDAGWNAPVVSQPGGANTLPLTITRYTSDGRLELKQLFEWDAKEREVAITMTVKNISGASVAGVKLSRYFDGDIDTSVHPDYGAQGDLLAHDDRYAATSNSVWGWDDGAGARHHGLMLTAISAAYPNSASVEKFSDWASTGAGARTARTCTPVSQASPTAPGDYVGRLTYSFGTLAAGASRIVKVQYKRM